MNPPTAIPAMQLWAEMSAMPRPWRLVPFPRKKANGEPVCEVAMVILTQDEHLRSGVAAEKLVRQELPNAEQGKSAGYDVAYSNAVCVEQLYRACREPGKLDTPAFPSPKDMRAQLTTEEVGALYQAFLEVTADIGPIRGGLTTVEENAWIDRLIEGGSHDPLGYFSRAALTRLLQCAVKRLQQSPTAPSSAGSPPDAIESATSKSDRIGD